MYTEFFTQVGNFSFQVLWDIALEILNLQNVRQINNLNVKFYNNSVK